ncbi:MAG TPA: ATP-binding protein [Blastocatellia bacterium]|nr:ATP-binding protein [Blastocatellia bacterium]
MSEHEFGQGTRNNPLDSFHAGTLHYERLLESLASLASELGTARELITVFRSLRDFAITSVPCSMIFISLYDAAREVRNGVYLWHQGTEIDVSEVGPVPVGSGPTGTAITTNSVLIFNDYLKAIEGRRVIATGFDEDPRMPQSAVIAPMSVMGRTIGAVEVQSLELGAYSQEHATSMRMAANLAAVAIENVRLLERERAKEEHLRQSLKMEAIGRLAGGIAHDFNNLLTVINGYSQVMLRTLPPDSTIRTQLEQICKSADRATSLTRQLLAFSRKQVLQPRLLELNQVVLDMNEMLRRLIGEDVELSTVLNAQSTRVVADPGQIEQVLMNLAVNARDAMPDGGKLTIETANAPLNRPATGALSSTPVDCVRLTVTDTGCGMSPETLAHIFEPFFTTKELGKGTGLGLATVYGIVRQSGGHVNVQSEPGGGTSFIIYLPLAPEGLSHAEVISSAHPHPGSETILLAEDDEMVRHLTRDILEMSGYTVLEAGSGRDAIDLARNHRGPIHVLVTDVVMPQINGRQLADQLLQTCTGLKVLYISGYLGNSVSPESLVGPASSFLEKPFTPEALTGKIRELLDGAA